MTKRTFIPIHADRGIGNGGSDGDFPDSIERRGFLKIMAASLALAGAGCSGPPAEKILPYVDMPERLTPGVPSFYATAFVNHGYAMGVLVESNDGRPTKVEGNPRHPSSLGATDVLAQASVLELWDPERSATVRARGQIATWDAFDTALQAPRERWRKDGGKGLRILTGAVTSPTLASQLWALLARYPEARWHQYDALHDDRAHQAAHIAFGMPLEPVFHLDRCEVVLVLDADLFTGMPGSVRYAHDWFAGRRAHAGRQLFAASSTVNATTVSADRQWILPPESIEALAWKFANALGLQIPSDSAAAAASDPGIQKWSVGLAATLQAHAGACLVVGGGNLSAQTRALIHAINSHLGNQGRTVDYLPSVECGPIDHGASIRALAADLCGNRVESLFILDGNPVYDAPADLHVGDLLRRVPLSVHFGCYANETAQVCQWHLPASHAYEQWSDARGHDGTACIMQPLIAPLHDSRSVHEVMALLTGSDERNGYRLVRNFWQSRHPEEFETVWQQALRQGVMEEAAVRPIEHRLPSAPAIPILPRRPADTLWMIFVRDHSVDTGGFSNNAWLQELPRPFSKLTWDNAASINSRTAAALGVVSGDVIRIALHSDTAPSASVDAPVWVTDDVAEGIVTLPLGYGRRAAGTVGNGVGFDAYPLMMAAAMQAPQAVRLTPTGRQHALAVVQQHMETEGRDIVRVVSAPKSGSPSQPFAGFPVEPAASETLYPEVSYDKYKWGMAIDLGACIGCNACTIACQAENNIPVVGKEEVARGREMHWIRVDRYRVPMQDAGDGASPTAHTVFQPVPCMHCENAPCEEVCPVGATVHDSEGLNVQVYNRCVGTRFCSNNCPYKVRRFNFLQYSDNKVTTLIAQKNPDVTVRQRGVMEKCTYCVQRITRARLGAEKEQRSIRDGEVVTACEAACPTNAIVFGDLNDPASRVVQAKASPLGYHLLAELNTRPRTSYRARVVNPAPEFE